MITHLKLKFGSSSGQSALVIETPPSVTIFVGPNNSGKSLALRELHQFCTSRKVNAATLIVDGVVFEDRDTEIVQEEFKANQVSPNSGESVAENHSIIMVGGKRQHVPTTAYIEAVASPNQHQKQFASWHLKHLTLNLDGPSRIGLVGPQSRDDLKNPVNAFARLLTDNAKREGLRKIIYDAFGLYFAIDAQVGAQLHVRFGMSPPLDERSLHDDAIEYMKTARGIEDVSEGVKAFSGILLQLHAGDPKVIIVDEPEAFLHPSLAQKLGKELAKGAATEGKHIFVATHSPQFVMGAILSGAKVNIIRLTYANNIGTARLLPSADLTRLMQDPLLRSIGVLSALFYDHVVVGEADADRAFYQEINERLLAVDDPWGVPHTLFLNAQNKQTIPRIIEPLRKLGIPAAGIADVDIFKEGGEQWTRHLTACCLPKSDHQPFGTRRDNTLKALKGMKENFKCAGGINILDGSEREAADNLCDDLQRYGLFVVRRGEVESWLSELDVSREKRKWLQSIFERMGSDPQSDCYVKPTKGDVWKFMGQVRAWLVDPYRRGIPD